MRTKFWSGSAVVAMAMAAQSALAQVSEPENLLPPAPDQVEQERPDNSQLPAQKAQPEQNVDEAFEDIRMVSQEVVQEEPKIEGVWSLDAAQQLAEVITRIDAEGLDAADYEPEALRLAIGQGEGEQLNTIASQTFAWLVEDIRDGRTPMDGRKQWFVMDPDADRTPTWKVLEDALASGDIAGALDALAPTHSDYAALKAELAATPEANRDRRALIRANMDSWRWLPRDLGVKYLMTNVPEYQLRLTVRDKIIKTYRTVVGKPGRTATPPRCSATC